MIVAFADALESGFGCKSRAGCKGKPLVLYGRSSAAVPPSRGGFIEAKEGGHGGPPMQAVVTSLTKGTYWERKPDGEKKILCLHCRYARAEGERGDNTS